MTKRTLRGTRLKRTKTSGFRSRIKTTSGRRILKARRAKGRHSLTITLPFSYVSLLLAK